MSSPTSLFRPYYYGKYKWDDYALDIAEAAEAGANLQRQSLRVQAKTLNAALDQATELRRQGEQQKEDLADIHGDIQALSEEVRYGFSVVVDRMDQQIELFSQANARLDEIHRTLKNPRTTEADELFRQGEYCFRQGLYEESLEGFLKAEQIYKVNYLLQFRIGSLFLEGRNRKSNVIDINHAEPHLLLATRYAEAEHGTDPRAKYYAGDAYFRAAKACYLLGEQQHKLGGIEVMRTCLSRALEHLARSVQLWPQNTAAIYLQGKCFSLLGQNPEALERFAVLSDRNRTYYADAMQDGDFEPIRQDIELVFKRAIDSPGPQARLAQARLSDGMKALAWAQRSRPESMKDRSAVFNLEGYLKGASRALGSFDVDIEDILIKLGQARGQLEEITARRLNEEITSKEGEISSLRSQKSAYEYVISSQKQQMASTMGSNGIGCLFVVGFYVLWSGIGSVVLAPWRDQLQHATVTPFFGLLVFLGVPMLIFILGKWVSRWFKNQPFQLAIDNAAAGLNKWHRESGPLIEKTEAGVKALRQQMSEFSTWRSKPR